MRLIEDIIAITDKMIAFAEQGDWEQMIEQQQKRQPLYEEFLKKFDSEPHVFTAELLMNLKEKNDTLVQLSSDLRDESKEALTKLRSRKKVANAYHNVK